MSYNVEPCPHYVDADTVRRLICPACGSPVNVEWVDTTGPGERPTFRAGRISCSRTEPPGAPILPYEVCRPGEMTHVTLSGAGDPDAFVKLLRKAKEGQTPPIRKRRWWRR